MPIDLNPYIGAITSFLDECVFSADSPIHLCISPKHCYDAECFTWGMLLTVLAMMWLIIKWRGIKI